MTEPLFGSEPTFDAVEEDLVVDLEHRGLVEAELARLQLRPDRSRFDEDANLGLVLLAGIAGLPARAAQIRANHSAEIERMEGAGQPLTDLDAVLFGLRRTFAERYGGWTPSLGKNRHVASVAPAGPGESKVMAVGLGAVAPATSHATVPAHGFVTLGPGRGEPMHVTVTFGPFTGVGSVLAGLAAIEGAGVHDIQVGDIVAPLGPGQGQPMQGRDPVFVNADAFHPATGSAGTGVRVGMVDTALYLPGSQDSDVPRQPFVAHATFVTSLIKQQAPAADVRLEPALASDTGRATAWQTARAMAGFVTADPAVDVINLSLGCRTVDGQPPLVMARAVERLADRVLIVAAAGNHGDSGHPSAPVWPAASRNVVAVGAFDTASDTAATFSPMLPWVDVQAAGVNVLGEFPSMLVELSDGTRVAFEGAALWSGTSFAAGTVSGAIAARMAGGRTAREALEELLRENGVVKKYQHTP